MKRDNYHYSFRTINGYPQPFKFIISPRELGKSTSAELEIASSNYRKGGVTIYLLRQVVDITEAYIESFEAINNKFDDVPKIKLEYNKSELKDGIVHVYNVEKDAEGVETKRLYIVLIALSISNSRRKRLSYPNIKGVVMDEFIADVEEGGEKYIKGEYKRFLETYNTLQREGDNLPVYFLGNPYSLYNPYFVGLGVDTSKLTAGAIITGANYVIQCATLSEELKEAILKKNPLYKFDDSYKKYAFEGRAVHDEKIQVLKVQPANFSLRYVFRMSGKFIEVYKGDLIENGLLYWVRTTTELETNKTPLCFDFEDLVARCALISLEDKKDFTRLKIALRARRVYFSSIECYYLLREIYYNI